MNKEQKQIEVKMDSLAAAVLPPRVFKRFATLPLDHKVGTIKFFAALSDDKKIIEICEYAEKKL